MKDVAAAAGVSLGTVSKVVNGVPVGEEYAKRVRDAIKKLDYHVNIYAQGLKSDRTYTVAVLIPNTAHPYFGVLTYYLNLALLKQGYRMLLCCTGFDVNREQEYINMVQQNKVDGIIGLTYNPNLEIGVNTPFVSIDRIIAPNIPCVASDNFAGGNLAAEKLAALGCKNVCFLRIGSDLNNEPNKRRAGFQNGCAAAGLSYFCVTDGLLYDIRKLLTKMGVRIPQDVQMIGFDGIRDFFDKDFTCSTIVQPAEAIAQTCVSTLLNRSAEDSTASLICLPVSYAPGGTTRD